VEIVAKIRLLDLEFSLKLVLVESTLTVRMLFKVIVCLMTGNTTPLLGHKFAFLCWDQNVFRLCFGETNFLEFFYHSLYKLIFSEGK